MAQDAGFGGVNAPVDVNTERVDRWLTDFIRGNVRTAQQATMPIWDKIRTCDEYYRGSTAQSKKKRDLESIHVNLRIPEAAMQTDLVTAIFSENSHQNNEYFKVVPLANEKQVRADVTKQVMESNLSRRNWPREWSKLLFRFARHPVAGMKICVEEEVETAIERVEIPNDPIALEQTLGAKLTPVSVGGIDPDAEDPESYLFEKSSINRRLSFYSRALDFRRMAVGNPNRDCQKQPHIHEFHYLTEEEIQQMPGLVNIDKLPTSGNARELYPQNSGFSTQSGTENIVHIDHNNPYYEVIESWSRIPWKSGVDKGLFTIEELMAALDKYGVDPQEVFQPNADGSDGEEVQQKWCVLHTEDASVILSIKPNYLFVKSAYPHNWTSYHEPDEEGYAESFTERIGPTCEMQQVVYDLGLANMLMRCFSSIIKTAGSDLTEESLKKLSSKFGIVTLENNLPIEQQLTFMSSIVPDVANTALPWIARFDSLNQSNGLSDAIQGQDSSGTASQGQMNNARGQQRLNDPFRRAVFDVLVPQLEKLRDLIFRNFNEPQWIEVAGENGILMSGSKFVTPRDITNRFRIVPMATFDFTNRDRKGQMLLNLVNILSRTGDSQAMISVIKKMLESLGFDSHEVADLVGSSGQDTNPEQELKVILMNPNEEVKIRPDDNHMMCLQTAQAFAMAYPQIEQQDNYQKYVFFHTQFLQQQMMQQAMSAPQPPQGNDPAEMPDKKRGPQVPPDGPQDGEGVAKQGSQVSSPADDTANAAGGMTGRAVPFGA